MLDLSRQILYNIYCNIKNYQEMKDNIVAASNSYKETDEESGKEPEKETIKEIEIDKETDKVTDKKQKYEDDDDEDCQTDKYGYCIDDSKGDFLGILNISILLVICLLLI